MEPLTAILTIGAVYRVTRLAIDDVFPPAKWLREKIRLAKWVPGWAWDLYTCYWCLSFYVACVCVGVAYVWSEWVWVALVLSASAVTGLLKRLDD